MNRKVELELDAVVEGYSDTTGLTIDQAKLAYRALHHTRHDYFQLYIANCLNIECKLGDDQAFKTYFPYSPPHISGRKPDIVYFYKPHEVYLIDPTISVLGKQAEESKKETYQELVLYLSSLGFKTEVIGVALDPYDPKLDVCDKIPGYQFSATFAQSFLKSYCIVSKKMSEYELLFPGIRLLYKCFPSLAPLPKYESNSTFNGLTEITLDAPVYNEDETFLNVHKLAMSKEVFNLFEDKPTTNLDYNSVFSQLENDQSYPCKAGKYKPSFHIAYAPYLRIFGGTKSESKSTTLIANLLLFVVQALPETTSPEARFIIGLLDNINKVLSNHAEAVILETGFYTGSWSRDHELIETSKSKYPSGKQIKVRDMMKDSLGLRTTNPVATRRDSIKVDIDTLFPYIKESGTQYKRFHESRDYRKQRHCPADGKDIFQQFYDAVMKDAAEKTLLNPLWELPPGVDNTASEVIKSQALKRFNVFHEIFRQFEIYNLIYHSSQVAKQLIHFNNLPSSANQIQLISSGWPNIVHICQGSKSKLGSDEGKSFCTLFVTTDKSFVSNVWGNLKVWISGRHYIVLTNWRRLSTTKLTTISDSYWSVLSSSFDTFNRQLNADLKRLDDLEFWKHCFGFRSLVALSPGQRLSELLMDVRYLTMAWCSEFTSVIDLIKEKFCPPYPNCFTRWVISRLKHCSAAHPKIYRDKASYTLTRPIFRDGKRTNYSTGGNLKLPGIWSDYTLTDIQDLFDDLFVYVLTPKEPSSIFHESIKSVNTILKYQNYFDSLPMTEQAGVHTFDSFKSHLLNKGLVGCWSSMITSATKLVMKDIISDRIFNEIQNTHQQTHVADIISTKACLPELEINLTRKVKNAKGDDLKAQKEKSTSGGVKMKSQESKTKNTPSKAYDDLSIKNLLKSLEQQGIQYVPLRRDLTNTYVNVGTVSPVLVEKSNGRSKVHDSLLDYLIKNPNTETVLDLSNWNLTRNNKRVDAHICIKSQYGAKREFYVLNLGAKCNAKVLEDTYKVLARELPEEMISEGGDKKLLHIEKLSSAAAQQSKHLDRPLIYTNGDCSKWSASDSMASFISMTKGLFEQAPFYWHLISILDAWSSKRIHIPLCVLNNLKYRSPNHLCYETGYINSTQNFLQGLMNYTSSVKAAIATRFSILAWKKMYPESMLTVRHLEHSDDYALIVRSSSVKEFCFYRVYHKICQKIFGITDSVKKTNSQFYILEFISLFSFNGQLCYPHIKKTKESGLNVTGQSYQEDAQFSLMRSSEAVRVGVSLSSAYILQVIQSVHTYMAYSLDKRNKCHVGNPRDYPVELFGMPDCLPLCYLAAGSGANLYRIWKCNKDMRPAIVKLYEMALKDLDFEAEATEQQSCLLFTPRTTLQKTSNMIKQIRRKIGLSKADILKYKEEHMEYMFGKPRRTSRLIEWMKSMYYNKSFIKAYGSLSKASVLLRVSHLVSSPCYRLGKKTCYLKEWFDTVTGEPAQFDWQSSKYFKQTICGGNINVQLAYKYLRGCHVYTANYRPYSAIATQFPKPYKTTEISNPIGKILHYRLNRNTYIEDHGGLQYEYTLLKDADLIIGADDLSTDKLLFYYKMYKQYSSKPMYGIGYQDYSSLGDYLVFLEQTICNNAFPKISLRMISEKTVQVTDRIWGKALTSTRFGMPRHPIRNVLDNFCLFFYLIVVRYSTTRTEAQQMINKCKFYIEGMNSHDLVSLIVEIKQRKLENQPVELDNQCIKALCFFEYYLMGSDFFLKLWKLSPYYYKISWVDDGNETCRQKHVQIKYRGCHAVAFKRNNVIHLIANTLNFTVLTYLYAISKKCYKLISGRELDLILEQGRDDIPTETFSANEKERSELIFWRKENKYSKVVDWSKSNLPIAYNKHLKVRLGPSKVERLGLKISIQPGSSSISSAGSNLFSLPLLTCTSNWFIKLPSLPFFNGDSMFLESSGFIYNYLTGNHPLNNLPNCTIKDPVNNATDQLRGQNGLKTHKQVVESMKHFISSCKQALCEDVDEEGIGPGCDKKTIQNPTESEVCKSTLEILEEDELVIELKDWSQPLHDSYHNVRAVCEIEDKPENLWSVNEIGTKLMGLGIKLEIENDEDVAERNKFLMEAIDSDYSEEENAFEYDEEFGGSSEYESTDESERYCDAQEIAVETNNEVDFDGPVEFDMDELMGDIEIMGEDADPLNGIDRLEEIDMDELMGDIEIMGEDAGPLSEMCGEREQDLESAKACNTDAAATEANMISLDIEDFKDIDEAFTSLASAETLNYVKSEAPFKDFDEIEIVDTKEHSIFVQASELQTRLGLTLMERVVQSRPDLNDYFLTEVMDLNPERVGQFHSLETLYLIYCLDILVEVYPSNVNFRRQLNAITYLFIKNSPATGLSTGLIDCNGESALMKSAAGDLAIQILGSCAPSRQTKHDIQFRGKFYVLFKENIRLTIYNKGFKMREEVVGKGLHNIFADVQASMTILKRINKVMTTSEPVYSNPSTDQRGSIPTETSPGIKSKQELEEQLFKEIDDVGIDDLGIVVNDNDDISMWLGDF
jgi:hypothetical protein